MGQANVNDNINMEVDMLARYVARILGEIENGWNNFFTTKPRSTQRFTKWSNNERLFVKENPVSKMIVDCAYKVHKSIGPGLLESAYHECMVKEFTKRNIPFRSEYQMPIWYDGEPLKTKYQVDFLVDDCVIVELKVQKNYTCF